MDFPALIERLGLPVVILVAGGWGLYKLLIWIGEKVVTPITASHVALVESAKRTNESNSETLKKMGEIHEQNAPVLRMISESAATAALVAKTTQDSIIRLECLNYKPSGTK